MNIDPKQNNNNIALAESAIANAIRRNEFIMSFGKKINVYALSAEKTDDVLRRKITQGLGLTVFVSISSTAEVLQNSRATAICNIDVSIVAPDIVSEPYTTTSNIASAIIYQLHGTSWSEPFVPDSIVVFTSLESSAEDGVSRELTFQAKINLI